MIITKVIIKKAKLFVSTDRPGIRGPCPNSTRTIGSDEKWTLDKMNLVFLHGYPDSAASWRYIMSALSKEGFHCIG